MCVQDSAVLAVPANSLAPTLWDKDETKTISANKLLQHTPISSNINKISASHSGLKCVNLNARSIVLKMDELRRMTDDTQPDII